MNLVDSSGWLEYFANGENADFFSTAIEDIDNLIVSTINIYEVYKKVMSLKNENTALSTVSLMLKAQIIEVDISISLLASKLSIEHKLPMADSIILATAKINNAVLWTQDVDFAEIKGVKYIKRIK